MDNNLLKIAQDIVEILKERNFDDCTDHSGYFTIKEDKENEINVCVHKSAYCGVPAHYAIYVAYEEIGAAEWKYTEDLSVDSLFEVLKRICEEDTTWEKATEEEIIQTSKDIRLMDGTGCEEACYVKLVDCSDSDEYGIIVATGIAPSEIQRKILEIKSNFSDDEEWKVEDVLEQFPEEWDWNYISGPIATVTI